MSANENFSDSAINGTFQPWALWPSNSSTSVVERHQWGAFRQIEGWHNCITYRAGLVKFFFQQKSLGQKTAMPRQIHMESGKSCLLRKGEIIFQSTFLFVFPIFLSARQTRLMRTWCFFCCLKSHCHWITFNFLQRVPLKISKNQVRFIPPKVNNPSFSPKTLAAWNPYEALKDGFRVFCSQKQWNKKMRSKNRTSF